MHLVHMNSFVQEWNERLKWRNYWNVHSNIFDEPNDGISNLTKLPFHSNISFQPTKHNISIIVPNSWEKVNTKELCRLFISDLVDLLFFNIIK